MLNSNKGMRSLYNFENKKTVITVIVRHDTEDLIGTEAILSSSQNKILHL